VPLMSEISPARRVPRKAPSRKRKTVRRAA
jgi:hypothetical protein